MKWNEFLYACVLCVSFSFSFRAQYGRIDYKKCNQIVCVCKIFVYMQSWDLCLRFRYFIIMLSIGFTACIYQHRADHHHHHHRPLFTVSKTIHNKVNKTKVEAEKKDDVLCFVFVYTYICSHILFCLHDWFGWCAREAHRRLKWFLYFTSRWFHVRFIKFRRKLSSVWSGLFCSAYTTPQAASRHFAFLLHVFCEFYYYYFGILICSMFVSYFPPKIPHTATGYTSPQFTNMCEHMNESGKPSKQTSSASLCVLACVLCAKAKFFNPIDLCRKETFFMVLFFHSIFICSVGPMKQQRERLDESSN